MADPTPRRARRFRFGSFELDVRAGELRKHGVRLHLREQPLRILLLLLEHPGEIVVREEIRLKLWPNETVVEFDHGINTAVKRLRRALGESAEKPHYIETVARRGYRFLGEVEVVESPALDPFASVTPHIETNKLEGKTVSHYRLLEKLGSGGMGVVFRAQDLTLHRHVALKFLPEEYSRHPQILERFRREARAAAALSHPNICTIYEIGAHDRRPFIAMELLEGQTFRDRLTGTPFQVEELVSLAIQIAEGLDAAHRGGIVHRDIKPANLFVTLRGQAKILDFGLAKLLPERALGAAHEVPAQQGATAPAAVAELTNPSSPVGTAAYMSPEQARGEALDAHTDLFSFGAVLYEMATGRRAFDGSATEPIFDAILNRAATQPRKLNPDLPAKLEAIVVKALEKVRGRRYQSAAEILADLRALPKLEKNREWRWGRRFRPPKPLAALAIILLAIAAASTWLYLRWRHSQHLTDKDTVVLADFTNTTGDPIFDGSLRQGLSAQLQQSPFLSLVSDSRIAQTLVLMTQPKDARLTQKLAREVCQRTASAATIEGSISIKGSEYVLRLRAVNCRSGDLLAEEQVTANGKAQVLPALGEAATKMRRKLGESLASVKKYDVPPQSVTTGSLEALQAYSLGMRVQSMSHDDVAAIPLFQRAISLDPNFAMAFAILGSCYNNQSELTLAAGSIRRAYELRERVSELEKFWVTFSYAAMVTGNLEAARTALESWAHAYPRDGSPLHNLAVVLSGLGQHEKAIAADQAALRLIPGSAIINLTLAQEYTILNRLDEARATAIEARNLGAPMGDSLLYTIDFLQHDAAGMERDVAALMGKAGYEDVVLGQEADTAAYAGKFAEARDLSRRAAASAQRAGEPEAAGTYLAAAALRDALAGNLRLAMRQARAGLAFPNGKDLELYSGEALALAGDSGEARRLAGDLAKRLPEDTLVQREYLPMIQACTELRADGARGAAKAIEALKRAQWPGGALLRGEAYLEVRQGAAAAAEFRKVLDHPGEVGNSMIGALAHLGLGRAYALAGDNAKARTAYQDFLAILKDADPDIPLLKQAKAEYARLASAGPTQTAR